jgi:NitT/TauT family transport system permease protein
MSETHRGAVDLTLASSARIKQPLRLRFAGMSRTPLSVLARLMRRCLAITLFCLAWELLPRMGLVNRVFLPPFSEVITAAQQLLLSGALLEHALASIFRSSTGLALAVLTAVPAGLVIGSNQRIAEFIEPLLEIFRNTAPLALLPVFTLILGIGETSKIAMVLYASSWPILLSTVNGVRTVDPLLLKAARSMGLGSSRLFAKVVLPASVPTIFTGIRLAAAHSILVLIAAEMVGAKAGLGYFVSAAQFNFQIPEMYAGILFLALLGLATNTALVHVEQRLSVWRRI